MRRHHLTDDSCSNGSVLALRCGPQTVVCVISGSTHAASTDPYYTMDPYNNNTTHTSGPSVNTTDVHGLNLPGNNTDKWSNYNFWVGLSLAILSAFLIGGSVILKKKALLRLASNGQTRASNGGHGYLKDWLWWGGLLTMGVGEGSNFAAYMFAAATVVTPLGALSVLISAVLSSYLLGETLNFLGKLGCVLCILGSTLMVIHAPEEEEVTSLQQMTDMLLEPGFLVYISVLMLCCVVLMLYVSPRCGASNILVYVGICSLLGAFTVSSVKGLGIAIHTVLSDSSVISRPLTWILLLTLIASIVTQVHYLNKSLDTFNTLLVYPVYYVCFTSVVLVTSVILFQEWRGMEGRDILGALFSFLVIVVGVAMLHLFKEMQVSMYQLTNQLSQPVKREGPAGEAEGGAEGGAGGGAGGGGDGEDGGGGGGGGRRGGGKREDKDGLIDNIMIESLPPMREDGPRVFIIS